MNTEPLNGAALGVFLTPRPLPPDLLAAIRAYWLTTAGPGQLTGGFFTHDAADPATMPYATIAEATSHPELFTDVSIVYSKVLRVRVYGPDLDTAGQLGDQLRDLLKNRQLDYTGARASPLLIHEETRHGRDGRRAAAGQPVWYQEREVRTRETRSRA
jgi:hypothetical protein